MGTPLTEAEIAKLQSVVNSWMAANPGLSVTESPGAEAFEQFLIVNHVDLVKALYRAAGEAWEPPGKYDAYGFTEAEVYGAGSTIFSDVLNHLVNTGSWAGLEVTFNSKRYNWEDTGYGHLWATQGGHKYFDAQPKEEQGNMLRALVGTKSVSKAKRKKLIKTVAAIGAIVAGGIFLGPAIAGALKGGKVAGAIGGAVSKVPAVTEGVIGAINAKRTVDAIKDGEVPPPPISVKGENFQEWATAIGVSTAESELGRRMSDLERQQAESEIAREVADIQRQVTVPPQVIYTPSPSVPVGVQETMSAEELARRQSEANRTLLLGGGLLALLLLSRG